MSTTRRSFLAGSLGAVALGVAACSSSGNGSKDGPTSGAGNTTPAGTGTTPAASDIKGDLKIWSFDTEGLAKYEAPLFMQAYPNVKVDWTVQPGADYNKLLQTALQTADSPDVVLLHAGADVTTFSPALLDLTSVITDEQRNDLVGWEGMSPKGDSSKGVFGLPFGLAGGTFYYNKALFSQAGLDPEKAPASWPEFTAACAALKAKGIVPISGGDAETVMAQFYFGELQPIDFTVDECTDLATGKTKWTDAKVKGVFQKYLDLATGGDFQKSWRTDGIFTQMVDRFSSGQAGMVFHLNNYLGVFYTALKDDLGVFSGIAAQAGQKANFLNYGAGQGLCVTKRSKNPEAAFAFCSWKTSEESEERDLAALSGPDELQNGRLPTNKKVVPGADAYPVVKSVVDELTSSTVGFGTLSNPNLNPAVLTQIQQGFGGVIDGRTSLDEFMASLDKAATS
jgi:ABC-type glycerol-3-phosphate transport system substrate-binding protein